ncbi:odorant receptor 13a-like [Bombus vancouverensis nearcticus]|uniref:odorant receptor 13a-like n=1 Tax=Bombus vancouverensis nearcticus TaxID=2705178 RepID=UPI00402B4FD0
MSSKEVKDLSITVTSFYMKFVGFWLANDYVDKRWRNIAMSNTIFFIFVAITIELRDLYFTWGNFEDTIYTACNVATIVLVLLKTFVIFIHNDELLYLINYAKTNFWHSNYDSHEQMIINTSKRICTFLVCSFAFFAQGTVVSFILRPILVNYGKNESDRIHPFNMWFDDSLMLSPYFEIVFVIQVEKIIHIRSLACLVGTCYHCFDNLLFVINLHTASQFRILQYRFSNMCNINDHEHYTTLERSSYTEDKYATFKTYVKQHQMLIQYCNKLENVFSVIALVQVTLFSLIICLDGYLILMEEIAQIKRLTFIFHVMGCMCQLLMFTYSCNCLIQDSECVMNATYKSSWSPLPMDKYGKMLRKDLMFVMMRSKAPCCLTACGFFAVSLETYTGILSSAVSYFTLLRNHAGDA